MAKYLNDEIRLDKCMVKRGHSERRPNHDYSLAGIILQKLECKEDLEVIKVPSLTPKNLIRRIVKELNYLLINIVMPCGTWKGRSSEEYLQHRKRSTSCPLHLRRHINLLEKVQRRTTMALPEEVRELTNNDRLAAMDNNHVGRVT